jgi:hypothetical protein
MGASLLTNTLKLVASNMSMTRILTLDVTADQLARHETIPSSDQGAGQ